MIVISLNLKHIFCFYIFRNHSFVRSNSIKSELKSASSYLPNQCLLEGTFILFSIYREIPIWVEFPIVLMWALNFSSHLASISPYHPKITSKTSNLNSFMRQVLIMFRPILLINPFFKYLLPLSDKEYGLSKYHLNHLYFWHQQLPARPLQVAPYSIDWRCN